jgi:16S rRNA (cytosine967-C5)-methyltransferase
LNVKQRIIKLLGEFEDGKYSNILLNEYFRENELSRGEKAFITEVFYGVIRNIIFLDYQIDKRATKKVHRRWLRNLLRISYYQAYFMRSDDAGVAWEATELAKKKLGVYVGRFANGIVRSFMREMDGEAEELKKNGQMDILYSCPKWFYEKINKEYGEETEAILKSYKKIPYLSVRVNKLKYSEEEFEALIEKNEINIMKQIDSVYYLDSGILIDSQEFKDGKITIQDGSSYLAAKMLGAKPGESVLDTCSAPGSKAAVLAEIMENKGEITALDIHQHKIKLLDMNSKNLGTKIITGVKLDARKVKEQGKKFDKILVDAPCSGYGVLRKKPEALYNKDMTNVAELANLQYEILESASKSLKDTGEIIYSTCTIFKEENTDNAERFLKNNPEFQVVEIELPEGISGHKDILGGLVIDYKEEFLDSFYIIKFRKRIG